MPRTQYLFIDHENVRESDLSRVSGKAVQVLLILGATQKTLPTSLFFFAQNHPGQLKVIQTPVVGKNALDFVLTVELGRVLASDPTAHFHIVSRDTDFDSVIRHLQAETKLIARHTSLAGIPALRTAEERVAQIQAELTNAANSRPSTRKKLENKIQSAFENRAAPDFVEKTIKSFVDAGVLDFTDTDKVLYNAA